jgi:predicted flap endonuclease-1-like 5' DNA nuclease
MLIPRPSTPPAAAAGRPSDPGGDPLRERLAQVEVQSAATRSIATRVESEAGRAHTRLDAIEASLKDRGAQLDEAIAAARRALEARIEDVLTSRPTENAGIALIPPDLDQKLAEIRELTGPMRTALATMRQELSQHDRQFEARRARLDSLETRVATLENDARFVELRRASEAFDLRLVAIERAQQSLREGIEGRFAALEARMAELAAAPAAVPAKKKKDEAESELRRIKGIGPKYEKALRDLGVTTLAGVAALSDDDLGKLAVTLATPVERLRKLGWIEAARTLLADAPSE